MGRKLFLSFDFCRAWREHKEDDTDNNQDGRGGQESCPLAGDLHSEDGHHHRMSEA